MELNFSGTKIPAELKIPVELKFGGGPLGDGDPKAKCKEVSRTKTQLKLQQNKNSCGTKMGGTLG